MRPRRERVLGGGDAAAWPQILQARRASGTVRVWESGGAALHVLEGHTDFVTCVAAFVSETQPRLASGAADFTVRVWDPLAGGAALHVLVGHVLFVKAVTCFADDAGRPVVASTSVDGTLRLWDGDGGAHVATIHVHGPPAGREQLRSRRQTETGSTPSRRRSSVTMFARRASRVASAKAAPAFSLAATVGEPATRLATGHADGLVRLWEPRAGADCLAVFEGHSGAVLALHAYTSGDRPRLATGGVDACIRIWELGGAPSKLLEIPRAHEGRVSALCTFSGPDGLMLASGSGDMQIAVWLESRKELEEEDAPASPDDEDADGEKPAAPGQRPKAVNRLEGHTTVISALAAFSAADGAPRLASGAWDGCLRLWDPFSEEVGIC